MGGLRLYTDRLFAANGSDLGGGWNHATRARYPRHVDH